MQIRVQNKRKSVRKSIYVGDVSRTQIKPTGWKWLDEIPVYPQERFAYHKRPFWHVLCLKRIGLPCCILFVITVTCSLQIILLSNYSLLIISVLAENTLLKTTCHFLLLLVGFNTLTYLKDYDWSPILLDHQGSFLAPLPGREALLVSGSWQGKIITTCWNLLSHVTMENHPLRGLFEVSSPCPEPQLVTPQPTAPTKILNMKSLRVW